ncbi:hypothetical protein V1477_018659 [Vespula maculifrons]|uniref:Uncharacterized protein n=1 Tax=Vespula maculifrons TaxID=7453 RepID=A0ABD2AW15_VESMC
MKFTVLCIRLSLSQANDSLALVLGKYSSVEGNARISDLYSSKEVNAFLSIPPKRVHRVERQQEQQYCVETIVHSYPQAGTTGLKKGYFIQRRYQPRLRRDVYVLSMCKRIRYTEDLTGESIHEYAKKTSILDSFESTLECNSLVNYERTSSIYGYSHRYEASNIWR